MPTRTAHTAWTGGLTDGSGHVTLTSSQTGTFAVSFPKRTADHADGTTSPEELLAAAHASCFAMQFSHELAEGGGTPKALAVSAEVALGPDPAGGLRVTGITMSVQGEADGLDAEGVAAAAERAKTNCPLSKALAAVPISLRMLAA